MKRAFTYSLTRCGWWLLLAAVLMSVPQVAQGQELSCTVTVDYSNLEGTEFDHLSELEPLIEEYLNEYQWTDDRFEPQERIQCQMNLTFVEAQGLDQFTVHTTIASRRPIYGTLQYTTVFQHVDRNWHFTYVENQSLTHDLNRYDPIASFLDFYAYVILGFDYDTFSELGGTPYFEQARRIAELARARNPLGWDPTMSNRNRGALIEQILDPRMQPLREAYFQYHFHGLDHFTIDTQSARQSMLNALESIRRLTNMVASKYYIDLFFATKYKELTAAFQDADLSLQAAQLLLDIDPSHSTTYDDLLQ